MSLNCSCGVTQLYVSAEIPIRINVFSLKSPQISTVGAVSSRIWMSGDTDTWMTPQEQHGGRLCWFCLHLKSQVTSIVLDLAATPFNFWWNILLIYSIICWGGLWGGGEGGEGGVIAGQRAGFSRVQQSERQSVRRCSWLLWPRDLSVSGPACRSSLCGDFYPNTGDSGVPSDLTDGHGWRGEDTKQGEHDCPGSVPAAAAASSSSSALDAWSSSSSGKWVAKANDFIRSHFSLYLNTW